MWTLRTIEWQFLSFVLTLAPVLVLALAAYVISVPRGPAPDVRGHYFAQARPFYVLLAVFIGLWTLASLWNYREVERSVAALSAAVAVQALVIAGLLTLAYTKREGLHWLLLTGFFAFVITISFVAVPRL